MKDWLGKISISLGRAICELLLAIALLANPSGLASPVMIAAGIIIVANWHWLVQMMGALTTLYALIIRVSTFMKLQIVVDAFRGSRPFWYLMAIGTVCAVAVVALLFSPIQRKTVWITAGIPLIAAAVLDGAYFWLGRRQ